MNSKLFWIPLLILLRNSESLGVSSAEWNNPSQPGSSLWLKNGKKTAIRIESLFIRNDGFRSGDEVALKFGGGTFFYTAQKGKAGQWSRLVPFKGARKIRIRAEDSLMATGFEYGNRLKAKRPRKVLEEEYVLDLKLVDNTGDSSIVKVSESSTKYYINGTADGGGAAKE
jgi:hypothetical protein